MKKTGGRSEGIPTARSSLKQTKENIISASLERALMERTEQSEGARLLDKRGQKLLTGPVTIKSI